MDFEIGWTRGLRRLEQPPVLAIRNLTISVGEQSSCVVDGVDLDVYPGEIVGLVGESGSGKTMTALAVLGLLPRAARVVAGQIEFESVNLLTLSERSMARIRGDKLAMILQSPTSAMNPLMRVGDQIAEPLALHTKLDRGTRRRQAVKLAQQVQIPRAEDRLNDYPFKFSGGMLQRASLASALACGPALLVADEPTTALDVTIQAQILELLSSVRDERGTAILLISHDLGVIAEICDRMVVMYAGRVLEAGPVREVFANPAHPYTVALLQATPRIDRDVALEPIAGQLPKPSEIDSGCRFAPRCIHRFSKCSIEPGLIQVQTHHRSRCWLAMAQP